MTLFFLVIAYFDWGGLSTQFTPYPYPIDPIYTVYIQVKPELGGPRPPRPPSKYALANNDLAFELI